MKPYLGLLGRVVLEGQDVPDMPGGATRSIVGAEVRYDLTVGFPAVTTKKLYFESVVAELIWFLRMRDGRANVQELRELGCTIWDDDQTVFAAKGKAQFEGDAGRIYGVQWRSWLGANNETYDQLRWAINTLKKNPYSRRIIVSAWNPAEIEDMALPPCHVLFQFEVRNGKLITIMYQRSCDMMLGVPFNVASYALLTHLVAREVNLEAGAFVHMLADVHIYEQHLEAARMQLKRPMHSLPRLWLNGNVRRVDAFSPGHIRLLDYVHEGPISLKMVVQSKK